MASIESVHHQTFKDLEIIVVDDGSTDDTEQLLQELALPKLRYIRHGRNRGANIARNTGIQAAKGIYIAFQDSDDIWHSEKLSKQLRACQEFGSEVGFCAFKRIQGGKSTIIPKPGYNIKPGCKNLHADLLRGSFISCQTLLATKAALLRTGAFDESLPRLQDWELCLRLSKYYPLVFTEETLVKVKVGPTSITSGTANFATAAKIILAKHKDDFAEDRTAAAILCLNVTADALRKRNYREVFRFIWKTLYWGRVFIPISLYILVRRR